MSDIPTDLDDTTTVSVFPTVSVSATDDLDSLTSTSLSFTSDSLGSVSLSITPIRSGLTASDISDTITQAQESLTSVLGLPTTVSSSILSSPRTPSSKVSQTSKALSSTSNTLSSSSRVLSTSKAVINVIPSITSLHTSHSLPAVTPSHQSSSTVAVHSTSIIIPNSSSTISSESQVLQSFTFITHSGPALSPSTSPSLPVLPTSIQSSNATSPDPPKPNYTAAIWGVIGTICLLAALTSLLIWVYKRRRAAASCSSPIWPTFTNDNNNFKISGGSTPRGDNETREMSYEGSRRFRFPNYPGLSRRPLTFSPPETVSSNGSKIQFPSENSLQTRQRKISPALLLPPSLEQSLTRSLLHERRLRSEESNNKPESNTDIMFKPLSDPIQVPLPLTRESSVANAERSPSLRLASPIPQIRLEILATPSTALGSESDSHSSPFNPFTYPASDTLLTPRSSAFLVPPTPKYTPMKATVTAMTSPVSAPAPIPISPQTENQQQLLELKGLEQSGILPERLPSWASSLRTNLLHAVQYMNSKQNAAAGGQDQLLSDNSSLYSDEGPTSDSESLKSSVRSATGTVPSEAKRPIAQRWVVVNGGTKRQSVESSCG